MYIVFYFADKGRLGDFYSYVALIRDVDNVDTDYSDLSDSIDGADCNCPDIKVNSQQYRNRFGEPTMQCRLELVWTARAVQNS